MLLGVMETSLSPNSHQPYPLLSRYPKVFCLLLPVVLLFFHCWYYLPFLSDDSLISLRYSQRLLDGFGLTWTDGLPVEGYSNLLLVLLVACLGYFSLDLILAVRLIGLFSILLVFIVNYLCWKDNDEISRIYLLASQLTLACSAPIAVWAIGGLEQPLAAALLAIAVMFLWRFFDNLNFSSLFFSSFFLGLLCLCRPDSPLLCLCFAVVIIIRRGFDRKSISTCFALSFFPILLYGAQLAFRMHYYNAYVPNTAYAKITPSLMSFLSGARYLLFGVFTLAPVLYFVVRTCRLQSVWDKYGDRLFSVLLCSLVWCGYVLFIGGDIFPAHRHLVYVVVLLSMVFPLTSYFFSICTALENSEANFADSGGISFSTIC